MTEVSYQPDEVGLEADDGRSVSVSTEGGEVLCSTENILAGLSDGVYLLQELCKENVKREKHKEHKEKGDKEKLPIPSHLVLLVNKYGI